MIPHQVIFIHGIGNDPGRRLDPGSDSAGGTKRGVAILRLRHRLGFPPDELSKVFEKFFRGVTTTAETRGAGLGQAIVKSLVDLHGGRIWVESASGKGSAFYFILHLTQAEESIR